MKKKSNLMMSQTTNTAGMQLLDATWRDFITQNAKIDKYTEEHNKKISTKTFIEGEKVL